MRYSQHYQPASTPIHIGEVVELRAAITAKLVYSVGKDISGACDRDWLIATALAVRDRIIDRWLESSRRTEAEQKKRVYYLSIEYLIGRLLFDALINLGLIDPARGALASVGVDLDQLRTLEPDAALGNGGLGRLAACFMDSMASLGTPAFGYGIRYQHGLFKQQISDGWQQELPEDWLAFGNPWEFERPEVVYPIWFGGPPPPSRQGRLFPPCRGNPVISSFALSGRLLRRPVELGPVDPPSRLSTVRHR